MITFFKPLGAKLARALSSRARRKRKAAAVRHAKLERALVNDALRRATYERDGGRCRACHRLVRLYTSDLFQLAHRHHVVYRSAGGPDTIENSIILCLTCHDAEHRHQLRISGDPMGALVIER